MQNMDGFQHFLMILSPSSKDGLLNQLKVYSDLYGKSILQASFGRFGRDETEEFFIAKPRRLSLSSISLTV